VALAIANSPLVKTAIAGEDPNWGRIVMAVGKSGAEADRDRCRSASATSWWPKTAGSRRSYTEEEGAAYMKGAELIVGVDLGLGDGQATVWTCDLTHGYIDDQRGLPVMKTVLVAAVALIDRDGRVLLAQRPEGKSMAGLWEFPGGKVEPGETPEAALIRELRRGAGHRHLGKLPRAADLRQPQL
jgi:predicted NUDIX family NTP pyrophosphohydrolase